MTFAPSDLTGILGRPVEDPKLFAQALTHPSFANEAGSAGAPAAHNERLEFLGDAVLDLVVADILFDRLPDHPEGDLSRMRAAVVCAPTLARVARRLGIGRLVRLGQGEEANGGRERTSVLANALEALLGALYRSHGLEAVHAFIVDRFAEELDQAVAGRLLEDFKTRLQELVQEHWGEEPEYRPLREEGPDHAKRFQVEVRVCGVPVGAGFGRTKKEAEQAAAADALQQGIAGLRGRIRK